MKKTYQIYRTCFLEKYGGLSIYDVDTKHRYKTDNEEIKLVNKYGYALIGNPDHTDGTSTYKEYFIIHDDLFDQILATAQNNITVLKFIPKYVLLPSINGSISNSSSNLRNKYEFFSPYHIIQRKQQKTVNDH